MKVDYLFEGGPFGSYKNKRSPESNRNEVAKELAHVAKSALLDRLYMKIEVLIKEYLDKSHEISKFDDNSGLTLLGKIGNKKESYIYCIGLKDAMPVFRLDIENNTIVVIMSCMPFNNYRLAIQGYMSWFSWIRYLKNFLNSNIDKITETGLSFNYDGFDVKLEMDQDILDNEGRVYVDYMVFVHVHNIDGIKDFVNYFYNQDVRIKAKSLEFYSSMSSNEMYQQFIEHFPYLVRSTGSIYFDMSAMKRFDLENLRIISVLADPHSDVKIHYEIILNNKMSATSLQGIENFIHNEYNMTLEKFKEIAYQNKYPFDFNLRSPKDVKLITVSYTYNNPKNLEIKGQSRAK